jgi:hypothetical protein
MVEGLDHETDGGRACLCLKFQTPPRAGAAETRTRASLPERRRPVEGAGRPASPGGAASRKSRPELAESLMFQAMFGPDCI